MSASLSVCMTPRLPLDLHPYSDTDTRKHEAERRLEAAPCAPEPGRPGKGSARNEGCVEPCAHVRRGARWREGAFQQEGHRTGRSPDVGACFRARAPAGWPSPLPSPARYAALLPPTTPDPELAETGQLSRHGSAQGLLKPGVSSDRVMAPPLPHFRTPPPAGLPPF